MEIKDLGDKLASSFSTMQFITLAMTIKDVADLLHAIAWPAVALVALLIFRKSINNSLGHVLQRIPWERITSLKAPGVGELKLARDTKIPIPDAPRPDDLEKPTQHPEANA
jgi:hypothetical protein